RPHRAAGAPADARRMSGKPGMLAPDLVGNGDGLDCKRARLQEFEARRVERPFDLDPAADYAFRLAHHASEPDRLRRVETGRADEVRWHRLRRAAVPAALAVMLAAGLDLANKTLARQHDSVGNDLALRDCGAQSPGRADEHSTGGCLAQA